MKHIKLFESFEEIDSICKKYNIKNYTINPDGSVDVDGSVILSSYRFVKLPLKFGRVSGYFDCSDNQLTTLKGSPESVGGSFYCGYNQLTTLEGAPKMVGRDFYCDNNKLTTLKGSPERVGGSFLCRYNQLTTLEGSPREVGRDFNCMNNQLTTLEGGPREVGRSFYCYRNPVYNIYELFNNHKEFMDSLDWDYIRGNKIVKSRFKDACEEAGIMVPKSIDGYKYIYSI
jgi:hypothetical protein